MSCNKGISFVIDDGVERKPSEKYGMYIAKINGSSMYEYNSGGNVEVITNQNINRAENIFLGLSQKDVLSFEIDIVFDDGIQPNKLYFIKNWLFNSKKYRKLQIDLDGVKDLYFNCILKPQSDYIFSNGYQGVKCVVECNSPYAYKRVRPIVFRNTINKINYRLLNNSADIETLKPIISFKMAQSGNFSIKNKTLDNLLFSFIELQKDEEIIFDCNTGILTSSTGLNRFDKFNMNLFEIGYGINDLEIVGLTEYTKIEYLEAYRLGSGWYAR